MRFVGLLFLIGVTLVGTGLLTAVVFVQLRKLEMKLLKDGADAKPTLWLTLGQVAVGLTIATLLLSMIAGNEAEVLANPGHADRAPIHRIIGPDGASWFQKLALVAGFGLPVAMFLSVGLGSAGAVGGVLNKDRRAVIYGVVSLAINGLIVLLTCWLLSAIFGSNPPDPETEEEPPSAVQFESPRRLIVVESWRWGVASRPG